MSSPKRKLYVDGFICEGLREAAAKIKCPTTSLFNLLKRGCGTCSFNGHTIETVSISRYETAVSSEDFGKLVPVFRTPPRIHRKGEPLLVYPLGECPIRRGIYVYH